MHPRAAIRYILGGAWNEPAYRFRDSRRGGSVAAGQAFGCGW